MKSSYTMNIFTALLLFVLLLQDTASQHWMKLALATGKLYNPKLCDKHHFWTETQRKLCINYQNLVPKVIVGAGMAYQECTHQFRWRRWNCSANISTPKDQNTHPSLFGDNLILESKEAAFINAIFSAGVVTSIIKACAADVLTACSCKRTKPSFKKANAGKYKWNQCDSHIKFSINFSKQFIDSVELNWSYSRRYSSYARSLMNLHNNEVGRKVVETNLWKKCRCHGVSGSCTARICTREVPAFRFIGNLLKDKFDKAVRVKLEYISTRQVLMPVQENIPAVTDSDLVYLKKSPLYCHNVSGRRCKPKKTETGSCETMCCGRGYRTKERTVTRNCKCKFTWCCHVTCSKCLYKHKIHTCK